MIYHVHFFSCPSASLNKHTGPVWQLRWVEQDRGVTGGDKKEKLMCISGDGRMTQWFIQQRLDCFGEHLKPPSLISADILHTSYPTKHLRAAGQSKAARVPHTCLTQPPALCTDVMTIKRTQSRKKKLPGERERKSEAPISQQAAGMCFDFHPEVGSESPSWLKYYPGKLCTRGGMLSWSCFNGN